MPVNIIFGQAEKPEQCKHDMTVSSSEKKPRCGLAKGHTGLHWIAMGKYAGRCFNSQGEERPRPVTSGGE